MVLNISPYVRQLLVASSCQISAVSVGGLTLYPAVLLNQLKDVNSTIPLDLDSSTWVASIHGFAGILSIILPTIMQWKGRRFAFVTAGLANFLGWIIIYFAQDIKTILIGESFHGFGLNSAIIVSLSTISEMVDPKFRNISMILFQVLQLVGMVFVTIVGYFISWRNVCLVMAIPVLVSLVLTLIWPESPSWLACKGQFEKCEEAFILMRGTSQDAMDELKELIRAQKESIRQTKIRKSDNFSRIREFWNKIRSRDFYMPNLLMILLFFTFYWSGPLVIHIYAVEIIASTTNASDFICYIYIGCVMLTSCILSIVSTKFFKNKTIIMASSICCIICLIFGSTVIYFKDSNIFPKETLLFCVLGYLFCCTAGNSNQIFAVSTELIPVKHRGLGGALYLIYTCTLHSVTLKAAPYLFLLIGISGTFLLFASVVIVGIVLIWMYVPETKGRTLQDIENYYNKGTSELFDHEVEALN